MTSVNRILSSLGLKDIMIEKHNQSAFEKDLFIRYTPADYHNSERQRRDDVHRMNEIVLVHQASGLRLQYLTTESYYGDECRYKFKSMFILTKELIKLEVMDVDFGKQEFATARGRVPFSSVRRSE